MSVCVIDEMPSWYKSPETKRTPNATIAMIAALTPRHSPDIGVGALGTEPLRFAARGVMAALLRSAREM